MLMQAILLPLEQINLLQKSHFLLLSHECCTVLNISVSGISHRIQQTCIVAITMFSALTSTVHFGVSDVSGCCQQTTVAVFLNSLSVFCEDCQDCFSVFKSVEQRRKIWCICVDSGKEWHQMQPLLAGPSGSFLCDPQ